MLTGKNMWLNVLQDQNHAVTRMARSNLVLQQPDAASNGRYVACCEMASCLLFIERRVSFLLCIKVGGML